jgi:peptidoglycan/LPS O-acetylase OafA/YrhL
MRSVPERTYYAHVEGLRGVAALYVFVYHIWQTATASQAPLVIARNATWLLQYGHFAVAAFIVISGYCLGLPVANHPERRFSAKAFAWRRARRLMPAYIAALFLSVGIVVVTASLRGHHIPVVNLAVGVLAHLALVHNLYHPLTEYINGPMWSIALECQIYVVFALLLVPVWRRFGPFAQLGVSVVLGLTPHFLLHGMFDWTIPWLLALFGMGVLAAALTARPLPRAIPWRALSLVLGAAALVAVALCPDDTPDGAYWPFDLVVGIAIAVYFVASSGTRPGMLARFLGSRPIVLLGAFSYSLYLLHGPIVLLAGAALARFHASALASAVAYGLLVPVVLVLAYGFYRVAERPFLSPALRAAIDHDLSAEPATASVTGTVAPSLSASS